MNEPLESLHLDARALDAYRTRMMEPKALLAAVDHLAECAECRERATGQIGIERLRQSLEDDEHLTEAEFAEFAEDALSASRARIHLEACSHCREEALDLRRFVRTHEEQALPWWHLPWWPAAAAAALCASMLAGWYFTQARPKAQVVASVPAATRAVPDDWEAPRKAMLANGRLDLPLAVAALQGTAEQQRGAGNVSAAVQLESPLRTGTLSARPEFRWQPVAGATSYEVAVFDPEFRPVASSGALKDAHWTPTQDLAQGVVYVWELTINVRGERRTAPRPPELAARFVVLPKADRERVVEAASRYPEDHLLLSALYGQAGALDEARRELRLALAQGHTEAAKILNGLK